MIDLHAHVLPGIDDGAADEPVALAMCRAAVADGITTMVATPHMYCGAGVTDSSVIRDSAARLKSRLAEEQIPLDLCWGAEVQLVEDLLARFRAGAVPTYNSMGKYLLLEMPPVPNGLAILRETIFRLQLDGVTPILAHPERLDFFEDLEAVDQVLIQGALLLVSAGSLMAAGSPPTKRAMEWLRRNWVHAIASDAHDAVRRPPILSHARRRIAEACGEKAADHLTRANPLKILAGQPVCA